VLQRPVESAVYTPIEVVDFIIRATEATLAEPFNGASLSDEGVHVLDPFTGTGTFMTRLLQSGFIRPEDLSRKFQSELHANEILLLAYYIAAVNIEATYRQELARHTGADGGYEPFPGIVLTDTFQLGETTEGTGRWDVFPINNDRATKQRQLDIRVIFGNPPYSSGQDSANDNNANLAYPRLDASIAATYAKRSIATLKNSLYDSYVRAIRWASERLLYSPQGGVVAYVTNGGYIDSNTADGLRLTLIDEFHHLYVYNLRGNQRTAGEVSRKEGGKIFDVGSRATVAIIMLVKQPGDVTAAGATLRYRDIGDYLTRQEKLDALAAALPTASGSAPSLDNLGWAAITPNEHGDWINQRSQSFAAHLGAAPGHGPSIFTLQTNGLKTNRDAWNYNSSRTALDTNVSRMIEHYNAQADAFANAHPHLAGTLKTRSEIAEKFVDRDPSKFSWEGGKLRRYSEGRPVQRLRRSRHDGHLPTLPSALGKRRTAADNRVYQLPRAYPSANTENLAIGCAGMGGSAPFTPFMTNDIPDLVATGAGNAMRWFPEYVYDAPKTAAAADVSGLFDDSPDTKSAASHHNVTDHALAAYRELDPAIDRDEIFFYVYGILHSPEYRTAFAADLKKLLPRIPQVATAKDFWAFSKAGRELARLHTEYEAIDPWAELSYSYAAGFNDQHPDAYRVLKMNHPKVVDPRDPKGAKLDDQTRITFNDWITIENIPERAYGYELGSRSAIAWVIESNRVKTDATSGIRNDPNDWAIEHNDPTHILDLVGRVVTVSMWTLDIIASLPHLNL
jgi:predicted helicase